MFSHKLNFHYYYYMKTVHRYYLGIYPVCRYKHHTLKYNFSSRYILGTHTLHLVTLPNCEFCCNTQWDKTFSLLIAAAIIGYIIGMGIWNQGILKCSATWGRYSIHICTGAFFTPVYRRKWLEYSATWACRTLAAYSCFYLLNCCKILYSKHCSTVN